MNSAKKLIVVSSVAFNGLALCVYLKYWDPTRQLLREGPKNNPAIQSQEKTLIPKAMLREAILQQRTQIESCYDDYLRREPGVTNGSISVTWFVDETGKVKEPEIADTELQDVDLEECVIGEVAQMTFDPKDFLTNVKFSYRFKFKTRAPAAVNFQ